MDKQNENQEINLVFNLDQPTHFSDNVILETKEDVVVFNFTQAMPQQAMTHSSPKNAQARIVSRVVFTVPHFLRLADVCHKVAYQIKEREEGKD